MLFGEVEVSNTANLLMLLRWVLSFSLFSSLSEITKESPLLLTASAESMICHMMYASLDQGHDHKLEFQVSRLLW